MAALFIAIFTNWQSLLVVSVVTCWWSGSWNRGGTTLTCSPSLFLIVFVGTGFALASVTRVKGHSVIDRFQGRIDGKCRIVKSNGYLNNSGTITSSDGDSAALYSTIHITTAVVRGTPHIESSYLIGVGGLMMAAFIYSSMAMCLERSEEKPEAQLP